MTRKFIAISAKPMRYFISFLVISLIAFLLTRAIFRFIAGEGIMGEKEVVVIDGAISSEDLANASSILSIQITETHYDSEKNKTYLHFTCKVKDYYEIRSQLGNTLRNYNFFYESDMFGNYVAEYIDWHYISAAFCGLFLSPFIGLIGIAIINHIHRKYHKEYLMPIKMFLLSMVLAVVLTLASLMYQDYGPYCGYPKSYLGRHPVTHVYQFYLFSFIIDAFFWLTISCIILMGIRITSIFAKKLKKHEEVKLSHG